MKKEKYCLEDGTPSYIIEPEEGKMFVSKRNGCKVYGKIYLGYSFVNGESVLDAPSDYYETNIVTNDVTTDSEATYKVLVEQYIRELYSISDELAILRQRDTKTEEFNAYFEYCEECKIKAKSEVEQ